eukprot:Hpha_TRINITY_DN16402_c1_g1::TRINITY_DN16402_c1_g1_i1::g.160946::m.160946
MRTSFTTWPLATGTEEERRAASDQVSQAVEPPLHVTLLAKLRRLCFRLNKCFMKEDDSPGDRFVKETFLPITEIGLIGCLFEIPGSDVFGLFPPFIGILGCIIFLVYAWRGWDMGRALDIQLPLIVMSCLVNDYQHAVVLEARTWNFIVLMLDAALVYHRPRFPPFAITITLSYIAVDATEQAVRIGWYDLPNYSTPPACDCADPPCAAGVQSSGLYYMWTAMILVGDFILTRGFAHSLETQLRRVRASVEVAGSIAGALVRYNVDEAEDVIDAGAELPEEMKKSFRQLVVNLRSYRPFLPHSVLVPREEGTLPELILPNPEGAEGSMKRHDLSMSTEPPAVDPDPNADSVGDAPQMKGPIGSPHFLPRKGSRLSGLGSSQSPSDASSVDQREVSLLRLKLMARKARASLACSNMTGYLAYHTDLSGAAHQEWMTHDVEGWCSAVSAAKGVVDLIGGDRRWASFNARSICGGHASAAVSVLSGRNTGRCTGCVVTGQAVCGDFGGPSMLRFMSLGGVPCSLYPLERVAALWNVGVLGDCEAYHAACFSWNGILMGAVFYNKRSKGPVRLYKMTCRRGGEKGTSEEWMYTLAALQPGLHARANEEKEAQVREKLKLLEEQEAREFVTSEVSTPGRRGVVWRLADVETAEL